MLRLDLVKTGSGDDAVGAHAFSRERKRWPRVLRGEGRLRRPRRSNDGRRLLEGGNAFEGAEAFVNLPPLSCGKIFEVLLPSP